MNSIYSEIPGNKAVALNWKVATSTLSRAIIAAHYPTIEARLQSAKYPPGMTADSRGWQGMLPKCEPAGRVVLILVRDPIERFRSACAQSNIVNVDVKLAELANDWGKDVHFWPQTRLLVDGAKLYRFPDHLDALAEMAGLSLPLPVVNEGEAGQKPTLSTEQQAAVATLYADDIDLFESIEAPATVWRDAAVLSEARAILGALAARRRYEVETGGIVIGGNTIRTDRESQAMLSGAKSLCDLNPATAVNWKTANGWTQLNAAAIGAVALAVGQHVQACFSRERQLSEAIAAAANLEAVNALQAQVETFAL